MDATRFTFTEDDLIAAQRAWWTGAVRWQSVGKWLGVVGAVYAGIALAATWEGDWALRLESVGFAVLVAIALFLVLLLIGWFLTPRRARRAFREHKALAGEFIYEWDADGVTIAHERGSTKLPWPVFHDWMVDPRTLMLFQSSILFNAVPRRVLADRDIDRIVDHLRAAAVPERKRFGVVSWKSGEVRAEP